MTSRTEFIRSAFRRLQARAREEQNRAMWQNFARALGLLAIALLAALYSSNAARDGRMIAAGISAMSALAIAIWVGIRFVPRLARNVEWDWLPFLSDYKVQPEGWIYFGAIVVVVFAAVNTNNNLLYMILSALMAVLLLSGFFSGVNFRWLQVDLRLPEHCFAGKTFPISFQLFNSKSVFPSFSLTVENVDKKKLRFPSFYVGCLRARSKSGHVAEALIPSRGRYSIQTIKIISRYPFGFFWKGREYAVDADCVCYPEIIPREQLQLSAIDILGSNQRFERGIGNDLYMIRDYRPSDSARHVHWKASAKTSTLKTREFALEESPRMTIFLDRSAGPGETQGFERLVSSAASIVVYLIRDGIEISLVTDEFSSGYGKAESHQEDILSYLAVVQPSASLDVAVIDRSDGTLVLSLRHTSAL